MITLDKDALIWDSIKGTNDAAGNVTADLTLPVAGAHGTTIVWSSDNTSVVADDGAVTRPGYSQGDTTVTLTATISMTGGTAQTKSFILTVKATASAGGGGGSNSSGGGRSPAQPPASTPSTNSNLLTKQTLQYHN